MKRLIHVVADRFAHFAENETVLTVTVLRHALKAGALPFSGPVVLAPGQGIDALQWAELAAEVERSDLEQQPAAAPGPPRLAGQAEVLKLRQENVLLSALRETGPLGYAADLVITDDTEMIQDHTADDQHIPGLLLMEACCQMIIAVTGRYFADHGHAHYAVMQHFDIDFHHFVFPLPAELALTIDSHGNERDGCDRMPFTVTIDIRQSGRTCARARWRYRAFRPTTIFTAEAGQAAKALDAESSIDQR